MEQKKVLHIIPGYGGGISTLVRNIVVNCDKEKIINDVAGFSEYPDFFLEEVKNQNAHAYILPRVHKGTIRKSIGFYRRLLKDNHYDAVHIHVRENQFIYFATLSKIFGCKRIIAHAHIADDEKMKDRSYRIKMRFWRVITRIMADQLASCSKKASEFVFGEKPVKKNRVMHVPNSVNIERYEGIAGESKKSVREKLGFSSEELIIGNVGYLGYQKNHPFMMEIAQELKHRNIEFQMLFIGHGWAEKELKDMCRKMDLDDCVQFLGRRDDVPDLFKSMDVAILPSFYEGLPTVAVEAQAAGIPQVISDTVTREVDLGLGIIKYIPLDSGAGYWSDTILEMKETDIPDWDTRKRLIEEHHFTAETAAELYTRFIYGEIDYYCL